MKRQHAIGCGVLFSVAILGACSAGNGPVSIGAFGQRDQPSTGARDNPSGGGGGGQAQGSPNDQISGEHTEKPGGSATASATGSTPAGNCPKCGKYNCTGTQGGKTVMAAYDFETASGGCADKETMVTLSCMGNAVTVGGMASGIWTMNGANIVLSGQGATLNCVP